MAFCIDCVYAEPYEGDTLGTGENSRPFWCLANIYKSTDHITGVTAEHRGCCKNHNDRGQCTQFEAREVSTQFTQTMPPEPTMVPLVEEKKRLWLRWPARRKR